MEDWQYDTARDMGLPVRERLKSPQRENGLFETAVQNAWWSLVGGYLRLYHRLSVSGREHLPTEPPFVLVANHSSQMEAIQSYAVG